MSSRFSSDAEANASASLENLEDIFPWYYTQSTIIKNDVLYSYIIRVIYANISLNISFQLVQLFQIFQQINIFV